MDYSNIIMAICTSITTIIGIAIFFNAKFEKIDKRFDKIEERLSNLENRVSNLEGRMSTMESMLQTLTAYLLGHKTGT